MKTPTENPKVSRRADARFLRDAMSAEMRVAASEAICRRITSMASFGLCDTILCYAAVDTEVDVTGVAEAALARGKTVAFPVCSAEKGEMEFYAVSSLSELTEMNRFSIPEPPAVEERRITPTETTMILMPGLLFDRQGKRIGYGGGYYDRYIRKYPTLLHSSMTVGVVYHALLSDTPIPYSDHDISAALVVTEKKLHFARKVEKAPKWEVRHRHYVPLLDAEGHEVTPKKRDYYQVNYVSPNEGKYIRPKAKDLNK